MVYYNRIVVKTDTIRFTRLYCQLLITDNNFIILNTENNCPSRILCTYKQTNPIARIIFTHFLSSHFERKKNDLFVTALKSK